MNRNSTLWLTLATLVAVALFAWAYSRTGESEEPVVAEIKELAKQPPSPENDNALRDAMRQQFEGKSEEERRQAFEQMAPVFIPLMAARFEAEYDKFMAMSPEERQRELDRRIDEMENRRKNGFGGPPGRGPGAGGNDGRERPDAQKIDEFRKKMLDWTTPEQRAKFENGIQMMNDRREERGLPPMNGPGGRF